VYFARAKGRRCVDSWMCMIAAPDKSPSPSLRLDYRHYGTSQSASSSLLEEVLVEHRSHHGERRRRSRRPIHHLGRTALCILVSILHRRQVVVTCTIIFLPVTGPEVNVRLSITLATVTYVGIHHKKLTSSMSSTTRSHSKLRDLLQQIHTPNPRLLPKG
jgi:hypothetical protein